MKPKKFIDYVDPFPPTGVQLQLAANLFACLKLLGELEKVDWGFIVFIWAAGLVIRLFKAFFKRLDNETTAAPHVNTATK